MTRRVARAHPTLMRGVQISAALLLVSMAMATGAAQPAVDVDRLGPQPGGRVPDFTATDQTGASRSLTSMLGPKGAMLVFSRSADW